MLFLCCMQYIMAIDKFTTKDENTGDGDDAVARSPGTSGGLSHLAGSYRVAMMVRGSGPSPL